MLLFNLWLLLLTIRISTQECVFSRSEFYSRNSGNTIRDTFNCTKTDFENFSYDFNANIPEEDNRHTYLYYYDLTITDSNFPNIYSFQLPRPKRLKLRKFSLINSSVEFIERGAFEDFQDTEQIDLSNNKLTSIEFVSSLPPKLKKLYLSGNNFQTISYIDFHQLEFLDLSYCNINFIESDTFSGFKGDTFIKISNNNLTSFDAYFEDGILLTLDVSFNNIGKIDSRSRRIKWKSLNASHNNISEITDISCQDCDYGYYRRSIDFIDLSSNDLNHIKFMNYFSGVKVQDLDLSSAGIDSNFDFEILKHVDRKADLSNNKLQIVTSSTFGYKIETDHINLSNSSISQISERGFRNFFVGTLNISWNRMTEIKDLTFEKSVIGVLDISKCLIKEIAPNAFFDLKLTDTLDLSHNRMTIISEEVFRNLTQVRRINLSFNFLKTLEGNLFVDCDRLEVLDLSSSGIEVVQDDAFFRNITLSELNLRNNSIQEVNFDLNTVQGVLNLEDNKIRDLNFSFLSSSPARVVLLSSKYLQELGKSSGIGTTFQKKIDLSNSKIETIDRDAFLTLRGLEFLNLSNNIVSSLEDGTFLHLKQLLHLDLTGNPLKNLSRNLFHFGNSLEHLRVSFSDVDIAATSFVTFNALKNLTIGNSGVITLGKNCFKGLISLENIFIDARNEIMKISPGAFTGLNSLRRANFKIFFKNLHTLETGIFRGLPKLEELDLSGLQLSSIQARAFSGLTSLEKLLLNHNKLRSIINGTFSDLGSLQFLNLSHNRISFLEPDAFLGLDNLRIISISNNNLSRLALGIFQNFPNLGVMNLHKNNINKLVTGAFSNLKFLEDLDLSYNNITKLKLQTLMPLRGLRNLDLTGNHLIQMSHFDLIRALRKLEFVGINANKWKCDHLAAMLIAFQNYSIEWVSSKSMTFTHENIDGIKCYDICKFFYCVDEAEGVWGAK